MHPEFVAKLVAICEERFWSKVDKRGEDECWPWTGLLGTSGYGSYRSLGGSMRAASREAYEMTHGPLPGDMVVCHSCDDRRCVNPKHLWAGTVAQNNRDRDAKGRQVAPRGEKHRRATITEDMVREIRAMRAANRSYDEIRVKFGVSKSVVYLVSTGRTWTHVV